MAGERYQRALEYATEMHFGQKRIGGEDYITHPVAVAEYLRQWGCDEDYILTGLFHDLLEDTEAEESKILNIAGERVLTAVKTLTKYPGFIKEEYVSGVFSTDITKTVKTADRLHNLKSAVNTPEKFKKYYLKDTMDFYLPLSPLIVAECENLINTLNEDRDEFAGILNSRKQKVVNNA